VGQSEIYRRNTTAAELSLLQKKSIVKQITNTSVVPPNSTPQIMCGDTLVQFTHIHIYSHISLFCRHCH
jgi:hypothetical protein